MFAVIDRILLNRNNRTLNGVAKNIVYESYEINNYAESEPRLNEGVQTYTVTAKAAGR